MVARDPEAARILDQLEAVTGLHGEHVGDGRRYDLSGSRDWVIALASMKAELAEISNAWSTHLSFELELED